MRRNRHSEEPTTVLYLHDSSRYGPSRGSARAHEDRGKPEIVVTGTFPAWQNDSEVLVETIRDPDNPKRLMF